MCRDAMGHRDDPLRYGCWVLGQSGKFLSPLASTLLLRTSLVPLELLTRAFSIRAAVSTPSCRSPNPTSSSLLSQTPTHAQLDTLLGATLQETLYSTKDGKVLTDLSHRPGERVKRI